MRLRCPLCGERDRREFYYMGAATRGARPAPDAAPEDWNAHLHLRDNVAGPLEELWCHEAGCGAWLQVRRDLVTHDVSAVTVCNRAAP